MAMNYVEISFDCLPLRSVTRFDVPLDASPEFRARVERVKQATAKHGLHNTYYLHNARCVFHLTNNPQIGMLEFAFEGTVLTDGEDRKTLDCDLAGELVAETCDWLTETAVAWFRETIRQAVTVEFDRYIAAGDLQRTMERIKRLESESDARSGFLGMGL
jgi:hypothetical protein